MSDPICPRCGGRAFRQETKYGVRHVCCNLWSWGGKPLVDAETHAARKSAHAAFDVVWKSGAMSRSEAYRRLSKLLGIPRDRCHMALMSAQDARRAEEAARRITRQEDDFSVIE